MTERDRDYFQRRAEEELAAAEVATDENAAMVHRVLAAHYRQFGLDSAEWSL